MVPDHWSNDAMVSMDRRGLSGNLFLLFGRQKQRFALMTEKITNDDDNDSLIWLIQWLLVPTN